MFGCALSLCLSLSNRLRQMHTIRLVVCLKIVFHFFPIRITWKQRMLHFTNIDSTCIFLNYLTRLCGGRNMVFGAFYAFWRYYTAAVYGPIVSTFAQAHLCHSKRFYILSTDEHSTQKWWKRRVWKQNIIKKNPQILKRTTTNGVLQ